MEKWPATFRGHAIELDSLKDEKPWILSSIARLAQLRFATILLPALMLEKQL